MGWRYRDSGSRPQSQTTTQTTLSQGPDEGGKCRLEAEWDVQDGSKQDTTQIYLSLQDLHCWRSGMVSFHYMAVNGLPAFEGRMAQTLIKTAIHSFPKNHALRVGRPERRRARSQRPCFRPRRPRSPEYSVLALLPIFWFLSYK